MTLIPGTQVGRYRLIERIGVGGMGEVYLAHDQHLDRQVAIKFLLTHLALDKIARERLLREARSAAALDSPFICKVFEINEEAGLLYIVMEYVHGDTLQSRICSGRVSRDEALRIGGEIAEAVEEAHTKNLVHRDLKPSNIMLTSQGRVKVMDFGLATKAAPAGAQETVTLANDALTVAGVAVGTPAYMSPEQIRAVPLDQRSDLFSFGIILSEILIGKHPFQRGTNNDTMTAILRDPPDFAVHESSGTSPGLLILIRRLLAKSPDDRYSSMNDVRADLARLATKSAEIDKESRMPIALVGRASEFTELRRHLDGAIAGRGSLVLIGGEPGIGKTHLTRAVLDEAAQRGCLALVGHCYEMEGAPPYVPFVEMLEYCARIAPRESFRLSIGDAAPEVAKLMPELRRMFPDIPAPIELPSEQQRRFLFNSYREFVERSARLTPIVAVFEDLHWADEPTLLLLKHLAHVASTTPVLMIGTYRDVDLDVSKPFGRMLDSSIREKLATRLTLRRLGLPDVQEMLKALRGQAAPPSVAKIIFDETEGNPFFVEEIFQHLREEGKLFDAQGNWLSGLRADDLPVPQGVRLVISSRLNRLSEETRRVLTTAALIGRSFSLRLLEELEGARKDAALEAIEEADRAELVAAERRGRETRYRFEHELVRQTLIEALSIPRRRRLHGRVALAIEQMYQPGLETQVPALAHHLFQAGEHADVGKTISYLLMAGRLATVGAAHEESLTHIENALSLIDDERHAQMAEAQVARANALRSLSRTAESIESYERAIAVFSTTGNIAGAVEASFHLSFLYSWNSAFTRASAVADDALRLIGPHPTTLRHRLLFLKAVALASSGYIQSALDLVSEAKLIEVAHPEVRVDGFASMCEARVCFSAAQLQKASELADDAALRFRAIGNLWGEAETFEAISAALWLGRPDDAEPLIRESLARAERIGHQHAVWARKKFLGELLMSRGDLDRAELVERDAHDFACSISGSWAHLDDMVLGEIAYSRGQFDEAARRLRRGLGIEVPTCFSGLLNGALFRALAATGDTGVDAALRSAHLYLPVPGRHFSFGGCGCLALVLEGLSLSGRREEAAALEPHAEHVVATGPLCVNVQHLFRTSAGLASSAARNWTHAEEHFRIAVHQADSAPYRLSQPLGTVAVIDVPVEFTVTLSS